MKNKQGFSLGILKTWQFLLIAIVSIFIIYLYGFQRADIFGGVESNTLSLSSENPKCYIITLIPDPSYNNGNFLVRNYQGATYNTPRYIFPSNSFGTAHTSFSTILSTQSNIQNNVPITKITTIGFQDYNQVGYVQQNVLNPTGTCNLYDVGTLGRTNDYLGATCSFGGQFQVLNTAGQDVSSQSSIYQGTSIILTICPLALSSSPYSSNSVPSQQQNPVMQPSVQQSSNFWDDYIVDTSENLFLWLDPDSNTECLSPSTPDFIDVYESNLAWWDTDGCG